MAHAETTPIISIVIPVYNTEKYIKECLDSIFNQTFKAFEVVVVNDGSTDGSIDIVNTFIERYPNQIRCISQDNHGMSIARRTGILAARGEYIAGVDSDDYLAPTYLEVLYNGVKANNAQVAFCSLTWFTGDCILKINRKKRKVLKNDAKEVFYYQMGPKFGLKAIFEKVVYAENLNYGEDGSIAFQLALLVGKKVHFEKQPLYFYRIHPESYSRSIGEDKLLSYLRQAINGHESILTFLKQQGIFDQNKTLFYTRMEESLLHVIRKAREQ